MGSVLGYVRPQLGLLVEGQRGMRERESFLAHHTLHTCQHSSMDYRMTRYLSEGSRFSVA